MTVSPPDREPGDDSREGESLDETIASLGTGPIGGDALPLERGDTVGRYVVLEEIGRGAMGVVVAAYDPELDRRVALKLMAVGPAWRGSSVRLLREAQAMARLAHPNVITVHDVGTSDDDVFIAMEFIEGGSLRAYLAAERRSWDEIVRRFIEAGEGLAAAHRQGIVHRDFKPDNVLVRGDGRACVGDFGLARRDEPASSSSAATPLEDMRSTLREHPANRNLAMLGLTATGATMGTPAYMAPEQHLRATIDHRADQFSFCVALWEALVGERPFAGSTLGAIALNVVSGRREPFPRDSSVPAVIRQALERGLSTTPEARFADMDELLGALRLGLPEHRRSRSRAAWLVTGAIALASIAAAWSVAMREPIVAPQIEAPTPCSRARSQLDGIWDEARRSEIERAFAASQRAYAGHSFERVADALDGIATQWVDSHTQACEATRVYGEQSDDMLDRRMSCLAERRSELAAVATALTQADDETIDGVDALLLNIEPIGHCDDIAALAAGVAPPSAEQRETVEALRAERAELGVLRRSIAAVELRPRSAELLTAAERLAYAPLWAEALLLHAQILDSSGEPDAALRTARRAVTVATECGHRSEVAEALTLVAWIEGTARSNIEQALWLLELAAAESTRLGDPVLLAVRIESDRASMLTIKGEYAAALAAFEHALARVEAELGAKHMRAADLRFNIAATHYFLDDRAEAERGFRVALDVYTALMGPEHPEVAQCHNNLAAVLAAEGKGEEAERHAARAVELYAAVGDRPNHAGALAILGEAAMAQRDYTRALELAEQAYAMKLEVYGADHHATIGSLTAIAEAEAALGRIEQARAHIREAIERTEAVLGAEHPELADLRAALEALGD